MPFVTPDEIVKKASSAYGRFLKSWVRDADDEFFPLRVKVNLQLDVTNPKRAIVQCQRLLDKSKAERGWGYTVHREHVRRRDFGNNLIPTSITVDSVEDLTRLAGVTQQFAATRAIAQRIRQQLPQLDDWLVENVACVYKLADSIDGLIAVTRYFMDHPWPDCYARQIPVAVDSKFVNRHNATLRQWLDLLLPATAIDVNESKFERRFGLRDGRPHRALRLLDPQLGTELQLAFEELSLPLPSIAALTVRNATVFIVENDLNLLTLPSFWRGLALRGEGNSVNRLESIRWLADNRVIYWGDIDVEGLIILSRLRNVFSHVESILMDVTTIELHRDYIVPGNGRSVPIPTNLTPDESSAMAYCLQADVRLEQEKLLQSHVDAAVSGKSS